MKPTIPPPTDRKALSIDDFCAEHSLSRSLYYKMRKAGTGPIEMKVGARTLLSVEAAAAWRRRMEKAGEAA